MIGTSLPTCHVPKVKKSYSSDRLRAGVVASKVNDTFVRRGKNGRCIANRNNRMNKKMKKQKDYLIKCDVSIKSFDSKVKTFTIEEVKQNIIIADGGVQIDTATMASDHLPDEIRKPLVHLRIRHGDLHVLDHHLSEPEKGIICFSDNCSTSSPAFLLPPRANTLKTTGMNNTRSIIQLCDALDYCENIQKKSFERGSCKIVLRDNDQKYVKMGPYPRRAGRGIEDVCQMKKKIPHFYWNVIINFVLKAEDLFKEWIGTVDLRQVVHAKKLLKYKTLSSNGLPNGIVKEATIFSGIAFGRNIFLNAHIDDDYTYSLVSIHSRSIYNRRTEHVIYFSFYRLGLTIPLRLGDVLIFNPLEPHSVSSRCYPQDDIFCLSIYLKSAVAGLHDNGTDLTQEQAILANNYKSNAGAR